MKCDSRQNILINLSPPLRQTCQEEQMGAILHALYSDSVRGTPPWHPLFLVSFSTTHSTIRQVDILGQMMTLVHFQLCFIAFLDLNLEETSLIPHHRLPDFHKLYHLQRYTQIMNCDEYKRPRIANSSNTSCYPILSSHIQGSATITITLSPS